MLVCSPKPLLKNHELEATRFPRKSDVLEINPQQRLCGNIQTRCQHHNKPNYDLLSSREGSVGVV